MNQFAEVNLERLVRCLHILAERGDHTRLRQLFRVSFRDGSRRVPALFQRLADEDLVQQFVSAAESAFRAAIATDRTPDDAQGPPLPALQARYALILASLPGHIRNVPPQMLARLIGEGVWTLNQAVAYVQQIPDTAARTQRLAYLAHITPRQDPDLVHAIHQAALTCNPTKDSGRAAVTAALPLLQEPERHSLVEHLLSAGAAKGWDRLSALLAEVPHLTDAHVAEAERLILAIDDFYDRAIGLTAIIGRIPPERRSAVLTELVQHVGTPRTMVQRAVLTTLLPHLDTELRETMRARVLSAPWWPARPEIAGGSVARRMFNVLCTKWLPMPDLLVGFTMSLLLPDPIPVDLARLLKAVADGREHLPKHVVRRAAAANPDADRAFERLIALLTPFEMRIIKRLLGRWLFDNSDSPTDGEGPDRAARLTLDAKLAASRNDAADAAAQLARAESLHHDGLLGNGGIEIVDSLMPHLPADLLPRAVALVQEHGDEPKLLMTLARYLGYLDEHARTRHVQRLIGHADRLVNSAPDEIAQLVVAIAPFLQPADAVQALATAEQISFKWRSSALAALTPVVPPRTLPTVHKLLAAAPAEPATIEAALALASRSTEPSATALRNRALNLARNTGDRLRTAECLVPVLRSLPEHDRPRLAIEALDLLKAEVHASDRSPNSLQAITNTLVKVCAATPARQVVIALSVANAIPQLSLRADAWTGMLPYAEARHRALILAEIVQSCSNNPEWTAFGRIRALAGILGWLEHDQPGQAAQLYHQAKALDAPAHRALVLAEIAHTSHDQALGSQAALDAAEELASIDHEGDRAGLLAKLVPHAVSLPQPDRFKLWNALAAGLRNRGRTELLAELGHVAPLVGAMRRPDIALEICLALDDIHAWWR